MNEKIAFVLGNGTSRKDVDHSRLKSYGKIYGCNALYRSFNPDYLIAVDVKMVLEISRAEYQLNNSVWTNNNKSYEKIKNLNYFSPSKGWSSGPTALWLACQHFYDKIFILGFDYQGLDNNKKVNNLYVDTPNYKKSSEGATYYGNWLNQTNKVIKENPSIEFIRVIAKDNYIPQELNKNNNFKHMFIEDFKIKFNLL